MIQEAQYHARDPEFRGQRSGGPMIPTCDLINTGSELVLGRTLNRHGQWLGSLLFSQGAQVRRQLTLPDGAIIAEEIERSLNEADIVLVTGGLGPTSDDLTRDYAAQILGCELVEDEGAFSALAARFAARGREMSAMQRRQALLPQGARALPNPRGTAPGIWCGPEMLGGFRARALCLLPGPPSELHPMTSESLLPLLQAEFGLSAPVSDLKAFHFSGIGEGDLAAKVEEGLPGDTGVELGYCAHSNGCMELRLTGEQASCERAAAWVRKNLSGDCFGEDDGCLEAHLLRDLAARGETVATAESCTGGLLASRITDVPGASSVFGHGFVTYANEAKQKWLGVPGATLEAHGAVSEQTALAMADGARAASGATHAVALTGIAGPDGGTAEKPVGTLWVAVSSSGHPTVARRHLFTTDRATFKQLAATNALDLLRRRLAGQL